MFKLTWLKLAHPSHSGRLRPHEYTSYIPLGILLLFTGLLLSVYTAVAQTPGPSTGSVGLKGTVPTKPPTVAATIKTPTNGQRFGTSPITVSGTCPKDTLVEIFKNDIFGGSFPCKDDGTFSVEVDLLIGQNVLIAKVYDVLNQPGPDSNSVTVFYDALPNQNDGFSSLDFGGTQLLLNTSAIFRGVFPEKELSVPITIIGGRPPYAINVQWGDSENSVIPRGNNTTFSATHAYKKPGVYQISLQGTDADGRVAFLTVASVVNGQPDPVVSGATTPPPSDLASQLLALWPLYTGSVTILISFWLGEWREKRLLTKHGVLAPLSRA